ncbi:MAG: hypothetical protein ACI8QZ_001034 [Chlamydiales bacterium]|jgi:uncharacterized protein YndB with AHSA1/START domain
MQQITHFVTIGASPERVFWALTTLEGLSGWWTERASIDGPFDGVLKFQFLPDFNPSMEVIEAEENLRVKWKCVSGHTAWRDSEFRFDLMYAPAGEVRADPNLTQVLFRQTFAFELDMELYGMYNYNWGHYLTSLKALCETGTGQPYVSPAPR